jgi:hypothetical protein
MMNYEQEVKMFNEMTSIMCEIFARKRRDYGPSTTETYEKFGPVSMLVRMHDKMGRLDNLLVNNAQGCVLDEGIDDTLMDLANYALITILERRKAAAEDDTKFRY